jgi:outer membrane lipoprotein-sorting protein
MKRTKLILVILGALCVLGVGLFALAGSADVEQQAEAAAGWTQNIHNSVTKGTLNRYDRSGAATQQAGITFYNRYPDQLRVELDHGAGNIEIFGFDQTTSWSNAKSSLSASDARDVRSWLRSRPERLFTKRGGGSPYREAGMIYEDYIPGMPWQGPQTLSPEVQAYQVEVLDTVTPAQGATVAWSDRRRSYYYVNRTGSLIWSQRWMEPEDPTQDPDDKKTSKIAMQVDFRNYKAVGGVQWPFDIVHWYGGNVDYRITVTDVKMNQPLPDTLFQRP